MAGDGADDPDDEGSPSGRETLTIALTMLVLVLLATLLVRSGDVNPTTTGGAALAPPVVMNLAISGGASSGVQASGQDFSPVWMATVPPARSR